MYIYIYIYVYVCVCVCVCKSVCVSVCVSLCVSVYVCIRTHVFTHPCRADPGTRCQARLSARSTYMQSLPRPVSALTWDPSMLVEQSRWRFPQSRAHVCDSHRITGADCRDTQSEGEENYMQ